MKLKHTGTFEELQQKLAQVNSEGEWRDLEGGAKQFVHNKKGILNWFPNTGTISFQGPRAGQRQLEAIVAAILNGLENKAATHATRRTDQAEPKPVVGETGETFGSPFDKSELIIGLVGAIGTPLDRIAEILDDRLKQFDYTIEHISISKQIIRECLEKPKAEYANEYDRISRMMDLGNLARKTNGHNDVLALGCASLISSKRELHDNKPLPKSRKAHIIKSLKHPDEVACLRQIYREGFFLIGAYCDEERRIDNLRAKMEMSTEQARLLIARDQDEHILYGQNVKDTFHLSDVFVHADDTGTKLEKDLWRFLDILFMRPDRTPTFDEYAMFMAFAASLRSAELSRQVGAVIAKNQEIIATGGNDCPRAGGGLYWPEYDTKKQEFVDHPEGRDCTRECDSNVIERKGIIDDIVSKAKAMNIDEESLRSVLAKSKIQDLTEYGRSVHAEMEALMCCARIGVSARKSTLYCTTFPCHNCAKHIIAAGVERVVYIEPYSKSKAEKFHSDAIVFGLEPKKGYVRFEPFVGIGPHRFFDLFSMTLGSGLPMERKDSDGCLSQWNTHGSRLRLQMMPTTYLRLEMLAGDMFIELTRGGKNQ